MCAADCGGGAQGRGPDPEDDGYDRSDRTGKCAETGIFDSTFDRKPRQIETVYGDETLLYSLLENLIVNALRASEESDRVLVCFRTEGPDCVITVEDHGCGIPAEHIPMLTEPFYRVDKARSRKMGGAGLGLAICQRIVEWHGGTLAIASTVGRGTTVTVRIPTHTT